MSGLTSSVELYLTDSEIACTWGKIINAEANPRRECGIQHLMLTTPAYYKLLLLSGPIKRWHGGIHSATMVDGRRYSHMKYQGTHWTWELFDAHWWDMGEPVILVGRWPD